jgi:hypothetical protein
MMWGDEDQVSVRRAIAWGHRRRKYDLEHPKGTHETNGYSTRPAFLDDLLPLEQGRRKDQRQYSETAAMWCVTGFVAALLYLCVLRWFLT